MYILIEGIDKTGKSTIARELSKRLCYPVINRLKPQISLYTECIRTFELYEKIEQPIIIDRMHLSEIAYGSIMRKQVGFTPIELHSLETYMLSRGGFNIYTEDDPNEIKKRLVSEKEEYIKPKNVNYILSAFNKAIKNSLLCWKRVNLKTIDYGKLIKQINATHH